MGAYDHMMKTGNFDEEEQLRTRPLNERTAILEPGTRLRTTPKGEKTVEDLVFIGDEIKSNDGTCGKVVAVQKYSVYGLPIFYPTLDGGWREAWFPVDPKAQIAEYTKHDPPYAGSSCGTPRERDVSNFVISNTLELSNTKFEVRNRRLRRP